MTETNDDTKPASILATQAGSVSDFQREVSEWAQITFPHQTRLSNMCHLEKEIKELREDPADTEEMADCFILLLNLCEMAGGDLFEEAKKKMEKNRKREWGEPDADGVCRHISPNAEGVDVSHTPKHNTSGSSGIHTF